MSEANAKARNPGEVAQGQIFVVDDEAMLLELAAIILQPLGYKISTFRDPRSALDAFVAAQPRPVLVITDYAMHSMTGMSLLEACRRIEPEQKVLLISGTVGSEIYQFSQSRPDRFLAKPYHAKELIQAVESVLAE